MSLRKNSPLISVIIPVYKVEKYLDECVQSVLQQSFQDFEIILVDDGSPDQCPALCDAYAQRHNNIQVLHKENGGLSSARNAGLSIAQGDFILFLDSDDYWDDMDALAKLVSAMKDATDLVVFSFKKLVENTGNIISGNLENEPVTDFNTNEDCLAYLIHRGFFSVSAWTKLIRKELLLQNNILFREGATSEDIEWSGRVLLACKQVAYVNTDFYVYRQRDNSIVHSMSKESILCLKNNLIATIEAGKQALDPGSQMYAIYMAYASYQYATFFLCVHNIKGGKMYSEAKSMTKYIDILNYSKNHKVMLMRTVYKFFRLPGLWLAAKIYMRFFYNKVSL